MACKVGGKTVGVFVTKKCIPEQSLAPKVRLLRLKMTAFSIPYIVCERLSLAEGVTAIASKSVTGGGGALGDYRVYPVGVLEQWTQ